VIRRLLAGIGERLGAPNFTQKFSQETLPNGPRLAYVFGGALLLVLLFQLTTGLVLAFHYSPSGITAWESVFFIETKVVAGSLIRAMHHHGASAIVLLVLAHLLQVIFYQSYRKPRELTWFLGLMLMGLLFAFALTGYLLPWDERGYGATRVATGLISLTPFVGEPLRQVVLGGNGYGHLTLTRFYAIHVILLPLSFIAILGLHLWSRSRHGLTGRGAGLPSPYWPGQVFRTFLFGCIVLSVLIAFSASHPAPLTAPADPATSYPARPEWYFLPLFQLLKTDLFKGSREVLGSHGLPTALIFGLMALPFFDRQGSPAWRRKLILGAVALVLLSAFGLSIAALNDDRSDEQFKNEMVLGDERARVAMGLAKKGIPPSGALTMMRRSPWNGEKIYHQLCAECHQGAKRKAPDLKGYMSVEWVAELIKNPSHERFFGLTKLGKEKAMDAYPLKESSRRALAKYLLHIGTKEEQAKGLKIFTKKGCVDCHETHPELVSDGPNLHAYGSPGWLALTVGRPKGFMRYGERSEMPEFAGRLSKDEMAAIVKWLYERRTNK
jgi:ubiquinol-cytochrome c reductase cytochrome b subunit